MRDNQCVKTVAYDLYKAPECVNNQMIVSQGYRKMPGNACEGGLDLNPITVACQDDGRLAKGLLLLVLIGLLAYVIEDKCQVIDGVKGFLKETLRDPRKEGYGL